MKISRKNLKKIILESIGISESNANETSGKEAIEDFYKACDRSPPSLPVNMASFGKIVPQKPKPGNYDPESYSLIFLLKPPTNMLRPGKSGPGLFPNIVGYPIHPGIPLTKVYIKSIIEKNPKLKNKLSFEVRQGGNGSLVVVYSFYNEKDDPKKIGIAELDVSKGAGSPYPRL